MCCRAAFVYIRVWAPDGPAGCQLACDIARPPDSRPGRKPWFATFITCQNLHVAKYVRFMGFFFCLSRWTIMHNSWTFWHIFTKFHTQMHLGYRTLLNFKVKGPRSRSGRHKIGKKNGINNPHDHQSNSTGSNHQHHREPHISSGYQTIKTTYLAKCQFWQVRTSLRALSFPLLQSNEVYKHQNNTWLNVWTIRDCCTNIILFLTSHNEPITHDPPISTLSHPLC